MMFKGLNKLWMHSFFVKRISVVLDILLKKRKSYTYKEREEMHGI